MILENNTLFISVLPFFTSALSVHNKLYLELKKKHTNCFFVVNKYGDAKLQCRFSNNKEVLVYPFYSKKNIFFPLFTNTVNFIKSTKKLKKFIKLNNIKTVYTSNEVRNLFYAVFLAKLTDCKVTVQIHLDITNLDKVRIHFIKNLLPKIDTFVFCSKKVMKLVQEKYNISEAKSFLLYNTVDTNKFSPQLSKTDSNNSSLKLNIGFVGRISEDKGVDILVKPSLQEFLKENNLILTIVGAGLGKYENYIKSLISSENKQFYNFTGPRSDVDKILKTLDIVIIPSKCEENCSLVLLEAMASGCVIIASNRGGNPEILQDSGILFDESKPELLISIISDLMKNPDKILSYKQKARERCVKTFADEELKCYI